jgi:hypothetical protein
MIQFVLNKHIDKAKWDACLQQSINNSVIVTSAYLDFVCDTWDALILNDYEAIFPLVGKSKYKIAYLYQPYFSRYLGVYSTKEITQKIVTDFIEAIPKQYKLIEFCLHECNTFSIDNLKTIERRFQKLDLKNDYDSLFKNYSENVKRNLKKAAKVDFVVNKNLAPQEIVELFKQNKGGELAVFSENDYKRLNKLMHHFFTNNQAISIGIYLNDNLCAAGFFIDYNKTLLYLKGAVNEEGKANGAMQLLFDEIIKTNCQLKNTLDFGGSSVESVARFYKSFGAKDCIYLQLKQNNLPKIVSWIKSIKK